VTAVAELPDGTRRPLIHIPDWDFNWQDVYRYEMPLQLPRGTTIAMEYTYDNSASNVRNPDRPPRRVIWGQNSSDEMGDLWLQIVTRTPEDRLRLVGDSLPKALAEDAVGYDVLLMGDPTNAALKQGKASTHYNLGTMFAAERRWDEAATHLRTVVDLMPDRSDAHNNLGVALRALGRVEEAIEQFRQAVMLNPSNDAARQNLAETLRLSK
jgi:Flp pilus assembly protein TadD